jgi:hypothetical protein
MTTHTSPQVRTVFSVGVPATLLDRFSAKLHGKPIRLVPPVDNWALALRMLTAEAFDGLLIAYPLPGASMTEFLETVRKPDSACRKSALILLAPRRFQAEASMYTGRGANRVQVLEEAPEAIAKALERLFQVAPRFPVKVPGRVEVREHGMARRLFCQTINVSLTGMLLRLPHSYRPGIELGFELLIPGQHDPLCGSARVVRATVERREPFPGVGVTFSAFQLGHQARLAAFLRDYSLRSDIGEI